MDIKNLVIIGGGPAGLTAAIYAARAGLEPVVLEGFMSGPVGGQLMTTTEIENFPGFENGIFGSDLIEKCKRQAKKFLASFYMEDVLSVDFSSRPFLICTNKRKFYSNAVIIATGATAKKLDVPGAEKLWQKGVTSCATCDGALPIFRDKDLFVIGGGDTAVEDALFLTKFANKIYIVHRRDKLRASKILADKAIEHPKISLLYDSVLKKIEGDSLVKKVVLENVITKELMEKDAGGVFFAIGHHPNTEFLKGQIQTDEKGFIITQRSYTNIDGVFAAGDVQDPFYRQAVTACGSGCMAALDVEKWLFENGLMK